MNWRLRLRQRRMGGVGCWRPFCTRCWTSLASQTLCRWDDRIVTKADGSARGELQAKLCTPTQLSSELFDEFEPSRDDRAPAWHPRCISPKDGLDGFWRKRAVRNGNVVPE